MSVLGIRGRQTQHIISINTVQSPKGHFRATLHPADSHVKLSVLVLAHWPKPMGQWTTSHSVRSSADSPLVYLGTAAFALEPNCPLPTQGRCAIKMHKHSNWQQRHLWSVNGASRFNGWECERCQGFKWLSDRGEWLAGWCARLPESRAQAGLAWERVNVVAEPGSLAVLPLEFSVVAWQNIKEHFNISTIAICKSASPILAPRKLGIEMSISISLYRLFNFMTCRRKRIYLLPM